MAQEVALLWQEIARGGKYSRAALDNLLLIVYEELGPLAAKFLWMRRLLFRLGMIRSYWTKK